ncbi:putative oocyte-secreted protein 1 homolog [Ochotona princeps]|uniref:putative oocyte-secreted protein 1 homolog n=1 Tax=Ochotona princeps TaxID=9978 RepID=UPI0027146DDB|nr:putative oocyte-secreted protein 1 homolog [Ochotona princeps]
MKTLLTLSLVHLLVAVTFWRHGESKVLEVHCTLTWLQVNLKALTIGDWYLLSDEVFLGHGCPVTNVYEDMYVFLYPTSDCDIKSQVFRRKIIFRTQLTFISRTTPMRGFTPISCTVRRENSSSLPATSFIHPRYCVQKAGRMVGISNLPRILQQYKMRKHMLLNV